MRKIFVAAFVAAQLLTGAAVAAEKRCGWVVNPTPGNWWLTDAQGDWILAFQGGEPAPGMELLPDISAHDFVKTNGEYGYACGCMDGEYDASAHKALKVTGFVQKPLAACKKVKALKTPA